MHVDLHGLRIERFHDSHIEGVQRLYELYLIPTYLQRLRLPFSSTDRDEISEYSFVEEILNIDIVKDERYRDVSVVVLDVNNKVVACSFNYLVDEKMFEENFDKENLRLSRDNSLAPDLRVYLKHQHDIWQGLDLFQKYNLRKLLYQETVIVCPEYRHKGLSVFLMRYTAKIFAHKCDAVLNDSQIDMAIYKKLLAKNVSPEKPLPGSITLRSLVSYDDFFVTVELFIFNNREKHVSKNHLENKRNISRL